MNNKNTHYGGNVSLNFIIQNIPFIDLILDFKRKDHNESLINKILNNKYITFILLFGILFIIIYFLLRLIPNSIINKFPNFFFWLIFIAIIIVSTLFYFITIYKNSKGVIYSKNIEETFENTSGNIFIDFQNQQTKDSFIKFIINPTLLLLGLILFFFMMSSFVNLMIKFNNIAIMLNIIIILSIIIIGLALLWMYLFKNIETNRTLHFIIDFIFFIPCLLIEFIEYIKHQFSITTNTIWILLIIEIIFIIFYLLFPFLSKKLATKGGDVLLKGPIYTNNKKILGSTQKDPNYSIAFQIWINPQPPNTNTQYTKFTSLFNYGNRPNILYNGKTNTLKIMMKNKKNDLVTVYKTNDFPYQAWLKFIIISRNGIIDIFLNNKLVGSLEGVLPYLSKDEISSGTKDGINGGIKNIVYFDKIINKNEIIWID
tara:strand:+ start:907 stop:2190 length:1284 start_codon:yes stop_codon:yes gene_type:complete